MMNMICADEVYSYNNYKALEISQAFCLPSHLNALCII
ncbi:hypothetical protein BXY64_1645 [Marinifilum flexuosum]|uniref:Uncharacterized protein n=1 Tax=Marinifilum flexuosum TaxID=1117708 RepID=A0A419XA33_9BACT|nr:hypothetical protein BXY64_1645 [Marinifilum flexuosum]